MIANKVVTKDMLTLNQLRLYDAHTDLLRFWRANPVIACEDLLGIKLYDFQAWMLQETWTSQNALWLLTRNGSKTMMGSIYIKLRTLLFEDQEFWIVSKSGKQARKLFTNIEKLTLNQLGEFDSLKDIYFNEMYRSNPSLSGFSHDSLGFNYRLLNNSSVTTLNGVAENNRGARGSVFFDEIGFMDEEQIVACEAFATTDSSQKTSIDKLFDSNILNKKPPVQLIYASSASDQTTYYYEKVKVFTKRYFAGDKRYFICNINVDIPLSPTINGVEAPPLLSKTTVTTALDTNPSKAMREYYNKFDRDGGEQQIIKSSDIERISTFILPKLTPEQGKKYILAYDPALKRDNAIVGIMEVYEDEKLGFVGDIVNMVNFKDLSDLKGNRQISSPEQIKEIRELVLKYNGEGAEYENILRFAIDGGAGGGGAIYSDHFMFDWKCKSGFTHRGMIDKENTPIETARQYPNAYNIINEVEPKKWRTIMVERMIDLVELGLVRMPVSYNGSGSVEVENSDGELTKKFLSKEEIIALTNIDLMKEELKMIHRYRSADGLKSSYHLRVDMKNKMHDDRFYVFCLLCNELHMLREKNKASKYKGKKKKDDTILKLFN